ncbi:MAG: hypothetical protein LQ350_005238 [Teloschistes chrysophthalmus]|nr:MAG: hypothetical protein LQ350_005238 [Niorma chrysophthalma]
MPPPLTSHGTGNNTTVPENIDPPENCDSDDDEQAIKESIDILLSYVKSSGSFATGGPIRDIPLPDLSIHDVGLIALPLSEHAAKDIIKMERGECAGDGYDDDDEEEEDDDDNGPHLIEEVLDTSLEIKRLVDLDGNLLGRGMDVDEEDFIQDDLFARDPDHEDYEGYMGNWGPDATHFYYDSNPSRLSALLDLKSTFETAFQATQLLHSGARIWLEQNTQVFDAQTLSWLRQLTLSYLYRRLERSESLSSQGGICLAKMAIFYAGDAALTRPTQTTEYFAVDKRRRQHLHERLEFTTHSHETSRSWKPVQGIDKDTLVVKKAKSASTHELLKRWETQAKEGETLLATMNQDVLKKLLGEKYAELTDLRAGPGNIGTNHQNKVPQKRKAEVIDLT